MVSQGIRRVGFSPTCRSENVLTAIATKRMLAAMQSAGTVVTSKGMNFTEKNITSFPLHAGIVETSLTCFHRNRYITCIPEYLYQDGCMDYSQKHAHLQNVRMLCEDVTKRNGFCAQKEAIKYANRSGTGTSIYPKQPPTCMIVQGSILPIYLFYIYIYICDNIQ